MLKLLYLILLTLSTLSARASISDVLLCTGCTVQSHFEAVAISSVQGAPPGERLILVVNPETNWSYFVNVVHLPPNVHPQRGSIDPKWDIQQAVRPGEMTTVGTNQRPAIHDISAIEYAQPQASTMSATTQSWPASPQQRAEIGAVIEFARNDFMIVLPQNAHFSSFMGRNEPAVANQIYASMSQRNSGWPINQVIALLRSMLLSRLQIAYGRTVRVCAVFNNGDSACYRPNAATPSVEHLIPGTANNAQGIAIVPGSGTGGDSGVIVIPVQSQPPIISFQPAQSDTWLFCMWIDGALHSCWIQVVPR